MEIDEAVELLADAVPATAGGTWMDVGAGDGTFTLALARILGPDAHIFAVDRDKRALRELEQRAARDRHRPGITTVAADFTRSFELPDARPLDGMLFANSLHYVRNPRVVLARLVEWLGPRGRVVFIEYDRRPANPWVPYPIDADQLPALCESVGLTDPVKTATRPSDYGGELYVALATVG
jgi:ubiquinone/menaquinone biosynthesis C-methylase UbiE